MKRKLLVILSILLFSAFGTYFITGSEASTYNAAYDRLGFYGYSATSNISNYLGRPYAKYALTFVNGPIENFTVPPENDWQYGFNGVWANDAKVNGENKRVMVLDMAPAVGLPTGSLNAQGTIDSARACEVANSFENTVNGQMDQIYKGWAQRLVDIGYGDAILRIGSEYNGHWHAWTVLGQCPGKPMNNAQYYAAAFRRVVDNFRSIPGQSFMTDMNGDFGRFEVGYTNADAYPGDEYVDIFGTDVYDLANRAVSEESWNTVGKPGLEKYTDFARARGKKTSVPEWGMWTKTPNGVEVRNTKVTANTCDKLSCGDNPFYIEKMFEFFNEHSDILEYHIYFHHNTACSTGVWPNANPEGGTEHRLFRTDCRDQPAGDTIFAASARKFIELFGGDQSQSLGDVPLSRVSTVPTLPRDAPDLIVTSIRTEPADPKLGEDITLIADIQNIGSVATPADCGASAPNYRPGECIHGVLFEYGGDSQVWSDDYTQSIAPGETVTVRANGGSVSRFWTPDTVGPHTVIATVNPLTRISTESNRINNWRSVEVVFTDVQTSEEQSQKPAQDSAEQGTTANSGQTNDTPVNSLIREPSSVPAASAIGQGDGLSDAATVSASDGDLDGSGVINLDDMKILLSFWETSNAGADLDGDGAVGVLDLQILMSNWRR